MLGALKPANAIVSASLQALREMRDDESLISFDTDDSAPAVTAHR